MIWHFTNMKVSNKQNLTKFTNYMKGICGKNILVMKGKQTTYVRMNLGYSKPVKLIVSMDSYTTETIDEFPEETIKKVKTPAGDHLFNTDNLFDKLIERKKILFRRLVAKPLFLRKCARPDI